MATLASAAPVERGVVSCAAYADGRRVGDLSLGEVRGALAAGGRFVWIGLFEPKEAILRQVQEEFGLHDLAIEDALRAHQRPKLEQYAESLFVVLRTVQIAQEGQLEFGETHIFAGPQYVRDIEAQVNQGLAQTSVARGIHVPITDASGLTRLTLLGNKLQLDSSTVIKRAGIGGLRGLVAERILPREIQNGFQGELTLAP